MKKRVGVAVGGMVLLAAAALIWFSYSKKPVRRADRGEPQKSVEQILEERSLQASAVLQTTLGQNFVKKDWGNFKSLYQPKSQFHDLAELIRASYIHQHLNSFSAEDLDQLLKIVYNTLERIEEKDVSKTGLLITQFLRLPLPAKASSARQQLESWLSLNPKENAFLVRLALQKIVTQDLRPPERSIALFVTTYRTPIPPLKKSDWIRMTDDIRSETVRVRCLKALLREYPGFLQREKNQALIVLGREPTVSPKKVVELALGSIRSTDQETFESGLRAIGGMLNANLLTNDQKNAALDVLSKVQGPLMTPFVEAKLQQLIPALR